MKTYLEHQNRLVGTWLKSLSLENEEDPYEEKATTDPNTSLYLI